MPPATTHRTIALPAAELRAAQARLDAREPPAWDALDDGPVFSVDCGDGYRAHVSLLLEDEGFVVDAALFHDGEEVDSLGNEHRYALLGDYAFEHGGRRFVISVVEAPETTAPPARERSASRRRRGRKQYKERP